MSASKNIQEGKKRSPLSALLSFVVFLCIIFVCLASRFTSKGTKEEPNSNPDQLQTQILNILEETTSPALIAESTPTALTSSIPYIIVDVSANVREGPGLNYPLTRIINAGDAYQIYTRSADNLWVSIDPEGKNWISISTGRLSIDISTLKKSSVQENTKVGDNADLLLEIPGIPASEFTAVLEEKGFNCRYAEIGTLGDYEHYCTKESLYYQSHVDMLGKELDSQFD